MFNEMGIPTICVVQNMSYFECSECQRRQVLFPGSGTIDSLALLADAPHVVKLPVDPRLSQGSAVLRAFGSAENDSEERAGNATDAVFPFVEQWKESASDKVSRQRRRSGQFSVLL